MFGLLLILKATLLIRLYMVTSMDLVRLDIFQMSFRLFLIPFLTRRPILSIGSSSKTPNSTSFEIYWIYQNKDSIYCSGNKLNFYNHSSGILLRYDNVYLLIFCLDNFYIFRFSCKEHVSNIPNSWPNISPLVRSISRLIVWSL